MSTPAQTIHEIDLLDVYRALRGDASSITWRNRTAWMRCLQHKPDKTPSLHYLPDTNTWKCFPCNRGGGILDLVVFAGMARDRSGAARWLVDYGLLASAHSEASQNGSRVVDEYEYRNEDRQLLYAVERLEPKDFRQKRPNGKGGWEWRLNGVRRVPYRLPELLAAIEASETIYVVEGEKDVDALRARGVAATTNAGGSGWRWPKEWSAFFKGARRVVLIPDCDEPGRKAAQQRAAVVALSCGDARILALDSERSDGYDISDWLADGHSIDELEALPTQTPSVQSPRERPTESSAPKFLRVDALLAESDGCDDLQFVVDGMLAVGGTAILAGRPKGGKSTLAQNLTLAVARGESFLGRATRRGAVLYLALEGARGGWKTTLRKLGASNEDVYFCIERAPEGALSWLREAITQYQPVLVIVDTMQRLLRVRDGNDYAEGSNVTDAIIELARESGAALLLLHHSGKTRHQEIVDEVMGSTAWAAAVDTVLVLRRSERYRTIASEQRFGENLPETVLTFDPDSLAVSVCGETKVDVDRKLAREAIVDFVKRHEADGHDEPVDRETILANVEGRRQIKVAALEDAVVDGELTRSGEGKKGDPFRFRSAVPDYTWERKERNLKRGENLDKFEENSVPAPGLDSETDGNGISSVGTALARADGEPVDQPSQALSNDGASCL
jgi:hypothetical protein